MRMYNNNGWLRCMKCEGSGKYKHSIFTILLTFGTILLINKTCDKCKGQGFYRMYSKGI